MFHIAVDVGEVHEIRTADKALACKEFRLSSDFAKVKGSKYAFVILYGTEFRLKQLCCVGASMRKLCLTIQQLVVRPLVVCLSLFFSLLVFLSFSSHLPLSDSTSASMLVS